ncbi:MAG: fibronectin type III domain-containing protein, partial [Acidimicrobiales bacterium]
SWKAPFFDGGTQITQYHIVLPDLGRVHTAVGSQRHFRLRNLPPGRHLVRVQPVNVVGAGAARSFYVNL